MPNIDSLNEIDNIRFPNGIRFRMARDEMRDAYIYFCRSCESAGFRWYYAISRAEFENGSHAPFNRDLMTMNECSMQALYKHAELHNPLCKKFEQMLIANLPIYKVEYNIDGHSFYSTNDMDMQLPTIEEIKKKKKPRRMIRLR